MTENTIVFTPRAELRKGLRFFTKGTALTFRALAKIATASRGSSLSPQWSFPWLSALAERDATNKRAYMLQQKVESYEMADEARREVAYARHAH